MKKPHSIYARWFKRPLDFVFALLLLILLAPLMLLIALFVLLMLGRPVFFVVAMVSDSKAVFVQLLSELALMDWRALTSADGE